MVPPYRNQMIGTLVTCATPAAMVRVRTQQETKVMACFLYCIGTVFVKWCFGSGALKGPVSRLWEY